MGSSYETANKRNKWQKANKFNALHTIELMCYKYINAELRVGVRIYKQFEGMEFNYDFIQKKSIVNRWILKEMSF